jgi:Rieske 2Fe-2S family protein
MEGRGNRHGERGCLGEYFASEEIFAEEQEKIFRRRWLCAGHVSQLPSAGAYFLFELGSESVIVLRDESGAIRALHNVCRHRGSRLCAELQGELGRAIRCPYHAWTYGLGGDLRAAPNMKDVDGFCSSAHSLEPCELEEWEGFLFLRFDAGADPLERALEPLVGRFDRWRMRELRSVHQTVYTVEANWKLLFHNYSECYHCPGVHPHLNKLTPYRNTTNDLDNGAVLGGPMWMTDADGSMTIGGKRCAPLLPGLSDGDRGHVLYYTLFPSMFLSLHPDYVLVHRSAPLGRTTTRIVCDWFFHPEAAAALDFDPQPAIEFWDLTNRQDWQLCAETQRGVTSRAYRPGPYSDLESQLTAFDREYLSSLGRSPIAQPEKAR